MSYRSPLYGCCGKPVLGHHDPDCQGYPDEVELLTEEQWKRSRDERVKPRLPSGSKPLLKWGADGPAETALEFDARTGRRLHVYPTDCKSCGFTYAALITRGYPGEGESWCLRCGSEEITS